MTVIAVPFHLDEPLPGFVPPLAPDVIVAPDLPARTPWGRMAALYDDVAGAVESAVRAGRVPVVQSGDCTTSMGVVAGLQRAGVDPPEVDFLAGSAIRRTTVDDLPPVRPGAPIYLHLDADVVDPREIPGLLFPAPGGPPLTAVESAVRTVLASGRVVAVGVACTWGVGGAERVLARLMSDIRWYPQLGGRPDDRHPDP